MQIEAGTDPFTLFDSWYAEAVEAEINDPDAIALFDFSQMYGAEGELTEHGRKRIAAGTTGRGRGRGLCAHTAVLPPAVARRSARPQQARAPRARSG